MRDKVLKRAILISIAVHLLAISFIGRTSYTRLSAASMISPPQRLLNVDLVRDPLSEPPKPKVQQVASAAPAAHLTPGVASLLPRHRQTAAGVVHPANSRAGGALNTGTPSSNGDLPGNWSGSTHVGVVPGAEGGRGNGSGTEPGTGTAEPTAIEPPRRHDPPPQPPQPPPTPPAPKKITVRVCDVSGMLSGKYCEHSHNAVFEEGNEPRRVCDRCKAPEPVQTPRIADRKDPVRTRYIAPTIPDSVEEGQTFHMEIEYYVEPDGSVTDVRVTRSSGNRAIDRAVASTAPKWRYDPAVQDGVARRVKVTQPVTIKT